MSPIGIVTTEPARRFVLRADRDGVLAAGESAEGALTLPAEAFLRLVYGRLDTDHAPAEVADDARLDGLRTVFPGF